MKYPVEKPTPKNLKDHYHIDIHEVNDKGYLHIRVFKGFGEIPVFEVKETGSGPFPILPIGDDACGGQPEHGAVRAVQGRDGQVPRGP